MALNNPISRSGLELGYFDYESTASSEQDLEAIAAVITETRAQVVALQEIAQPEQLSTLSDLMPGRYRYQAFARGFRTDRYVAFLSEIPFEEEIQVATSVGRDALAVTVDVPSHGVVTLVNCHADAFNSRRRRLLSAMSSLGAAVKRRCYTGGRLQFDLATWRRAIC